MMEAGKIGVGEEDMGDGMQCSYHPYRNNPGGICAFCLQDKLGKLVSSSFPLPMVRASTSSSSPSSRSDSAAAVVSASAASASRGNGGVGMTSSSSSATSLSLSVRPATKSNHSQDYYTRRARIPFLLAKRKKIMVADHHHNHHLHAAAGGGGGGAADIVFKRSKSTATPRRGRFLDTNSVDEFSPRKRGGFWSFLYLSSKTHSTKKTEKLASVAAPPPPPPAATGSVVKPPKEKCLAPSLSRKGGAGNNIVVVEDDDDDVSPNSQATSSGSASSFERKVSRSRSVGCGSRSFSGDFFERISSGFGDCTLRRVESQREGKPKTAMKERVKCGGIFSGFIMMTSSSSSSSSSSYWVSSDHHHINGKSTAAAASAGGGAGVAPLVHGRSKSWGWAFASPIRAFTKPNPSGNKRNTHTTTIIRESRNKNTTTPNLAAIPSLLAVRS